MSSEYTHRNSSYENRFVNAQTADFKSSRREINPLPNPIYKLPISYYDSPVKHSSLYPNLFHIRPVDYNYRPTNIGSQIDKTIQENKSYVFGGSVLQHRNFDKVKF